MAASVVKMASGSHCTLCTVEEQLRPSIPKETLPTQMRQIHICSKIEVVQCFCMVTSKDMGAPGRYSPAKQGLEILLHDKSHDI